MKKGIGPFKLGAPKGVGKMYKAGPAKKAGDGKKPIVNTDEMGRKGHFNPTTKKTRGHRNARASYESEYSENYQNVTQFNPNTGRHKKIGYKEGEMRSKFKRDAVMGLRKDAYMARDGRTGYGQTKNNFGVKKPKLNIK